MLTCLVITHVNVSALCRTNQHSGCHCHEEYAAFVLFLPSSHCSNCSPVFLRKSNVQLQENRQNPLIWNTKMGLRKEKLGLLFTLIDVRFHAKNHPCGWDFPCHGLHTHRLLLATFSCVSQLLFCRWDVVVAGWEAPGAPGVRTVPSSLLLLHHHQTPLSKQPGQEIMNTRNTNCLCAEEAGGWGHVEWWGEQRSDPQLLPRSQSHAAASAPSPVLRLKLWLTMGSH